jgi:hypothetical protein
MAVWSPNTLKRRQNSIDLEQLGNFH